MTLQSSVSDKTRSLLMPRRGIPDKLKSGLQSSVSSAAPAGLLFPMAAVLVGALLAHLVPGGLQTAGAQNRPSNQLHAERWRVQCFGGASGRVLLDTTFVGRVRMRRGGIIWQVDRATITQFDARGGGRGSLGRRNYSTADCVASAIPAETDLVRRFNRPGSNRAPPSRSERQRKAPRREQMPDTTSREDLRETLPEEVLPDSMKRGIPPEEPDGPNPDTTETMMRKEPGR